MNKSEALQFMRQLIERINKQDNRETGSPYYFCIRETIIDWNESSVQTDAIRVDGDIHELRELKSFIKDDRSLMRNFEIECRGESIERVSDMDILEFLDLELQFDSLEKVETYKYTGCFLTEEAADNHLKLNRCRYGKDAVTFVAHFWHNPEIEQLLDAASIIADIELIKH